MLQRALVLSSRSALQQLRRPILYDLRFRVILGPPCRLAPHPRWAWADCAVSRGAAHMPGHQRQTLPLRDISICCVLGCMLEAALHAPGGTWHDLVTVCAAPCSAPSSGRSARGLSASLVSTGSSVFGASLLGYATSEHGGRWLFGVTVLPFQRPRAQTPSTVRFPGM
ncbi:hypothetical protein BD413DRAFT_516804 [Trametes elegans]|nr:hypothetical protein BD413DRAFT_516804 [Trametes elegans]